VECAFGMLVQRWGILQAPMPRNIELKKVIALVNALAKLHNFCIDEKARADTVDLAEMEAAADNGNQDNIGEQDDINHYDSNIADGYVELERRGEHPEESTIPLQLMDGGHHFEGFDRTLRRNRSRDRAGTAHMLPRTLLHDKVVEAHAVRPPTNPNRR
jgi:hypothetical protein